MKQIRFRPNVPAEIRAIDQRTAMTILDAIHCYAKSGLGRFKPLSGKLEGPLRIRVGKHRVLFDETPDTITIHRVGPWRDVYR